MLHEPLAPYYPPHRLVFFFVGFLYLGGAFYIRWKYPRLHFSITLAFLSMAAALFVAANSLLFFQAIEFFGRVVLAFFFTLTWVFAMWSVKIQVGVLDEFYQWLDEREA